MYVLVRCFGSAVRVSVTCVKDGSVKGFKIYDVDSFVGNLIKKVKKYKYFSLLPPELKSKLQGHKYLWITGIARTTVTK